MKGMSRASITPGREGNGGGMDNGEGQFVDLCQPIYISSREMIGIAQTHLIQ
jgi:hypothetical protein